MQEDFKSLKPEQLEALKTLLTAPKLSRECREVTSDKIKEFFGKK